MERQHCCVLCRCDPVSSSSTGAGMFQMAHLPLEPCRPILSMMWLYKFVRAVMAENPTAWVVKTTAVCRLTIWRLEVSERGVAGSFWRQFQAPSLLCAWLFSPYASSSPCFFPFCISPCLCFPFSFSFCFLKILFVVKKKHRVKSTILTVFLFLIAQFSGVKHIHSAVPQISRTQSPATPAFPSPSPRKSPFHFLLLWIWLL